MITPTYHLAPYIHYRTVHGFTVLLDRRGDKYYSIPAHQFESLLAHIERSVSTDTADARDLPPEILILLEKLLENGLLAPGPGTPLPTEYSRSPPPDQLVSTWQGLVPLRATLPCAPIFFRSCALADFSLRFNSFHQITERLIRRKRQHHAAPLEHSIHLTRIFQALRPFYPRSYLCLFDSLALLNFLAHWRLFPHLVFGVSTDPFEAHCWVQQDTTVLCDTASFSARWFHQIWTL